MAFSNPGSTRTGAGGLEAAACPATSPTRNAAIAEKKAHLTTRDMASRIIVFASRRKAATFRRKSETSTRNGNHKGQFSTEHSLMRVPAIFSTDINSRRFRGM
jgi:hypothetical protein